MAKTKEVVSTPQNTDNFSVFETLNKLNVNDRVEKKNGLTYLSWVWAWTEVKKLYPSASYSVVTFGDLPYLFDPNLGYLVQTVVTIEGESLPMHLPVMDGANQAQKHIPYQYKTKYGVKDVAAATMFDINTAIMRCLVKNLAMFGLGAYIYAGSDLPEGEEAPVGFTKPTTTPPLPKPAVTLPYLNKDTESFTKVVSALSSGKFTIADVESKYKLSKAVKEALLEVPVTAV